MDSDGDGLHPGADTNAGQIGLFGTRWVALAQALGTELKRAFFLDDLPIL